MEDFNRSTHLLGATTLRNVLGTKCLSEILSERSVVSNISNSYKNIHVFKSTISTMFCLREQIAQWMEDTLDHATDPWGVKVERVEM